MSYEYTKQDSEYGLIKEGEYEVSIDKIETKELQSGKKKIAIQFRLRSDVIQDHKNRVIFEDIWQERDTEYYNRKRINQLLGTQDIEDGKVFSNVDEILDTLKGSQLRMKIVVQFDDYKQEDVNKILYYMSSEMKPQTLEDVNKKETPTIDISEDDLPF